MSDPNDPNTLFQRAMMLQRSGDTAGAAEIYRRLMRDAPANAQLLFLLGTAEMQMGNAPEGISLLRKSLRISPDQFRALCNLGVALHNLGRDEEALANYDRAIALNPQYAIAYNNRGTTLLALERRDEALDSFKRAIAIEPRYAEAHNNVGGLLRERQDLDEALASFDRAIALNPDYAVAHCNRGTTLNELCRPMQALASFDRAIAIDRNMAGAHCGRATALFSLKQLDEARQSNDRALALEPDHVEAHWNGALLKLVAGEFAEGWELQEWRWKLDEWRSKIPAFMRDGSWPLWTGAEPLAGKTLLVNAEQGYGDFVQFCRYLPMVRKLGANVVVEAKKRLLPLLTTLEGDFVFVEAGRPLPEFDLYCPIMSLPRAFGTRLETIPAKVPYLFAEPEKQNLVLTRLGAKGVPRIGLVWSGSPGQKADRLRSISFIRLEPLLRMPFEFHCLQKEIGPEDLPALNSFGIQTHHDEQNDFSDAAALIACTDLVITVDTAVAHVAGAMGKPVWILLPYMADWRWLLDRQDSPWYPTARLFRQRTGGDWAGAIDDVTGRLRAHDFAGGV
jgi:tetratricopeptide (TPR) repeat protein